MLEMFWFIATFIILSIIIIRPPKRIGIKSITTITRLLGSPSEAESYLNILTIMGCFSYSLVTILLLF